MDKKFLIEAEKILMRHDVSVVIEAFEILQKTYGDYVVPLVELWWKGIITHEEYEILKKYFNDKKEDNKNGK